MIQKIKAHPLPVVFLATLVAGLLMVTAAAFTVSPFWGLLTGGVLTTGAGHWVTYLRTIAGDRL